MKLKQIPNNTVVHTPTEAEARELLTILHENGYKWKSGDDLSVYSYAYNKKAIGFMENKKVVACIYLRTAINEGKSILTLTEFKERYVLNEDNFAKSEEDKPQPKFKVGDIVRYKGKRKVVYSINTTLSEPIYTITMLNYQSPIKVEEHRIEPYTEPETKPTEDMETKDYPPYLDHPKTMVETPIKELNLCELLKGHEGETFYSPFYGDVKLEEIHVPTVKEPRYYLLVRPKSYSAGRESVLPNGINHDGGQVQLFPSRALYEQYPLDPYTAWMKWQEEQKVDIIKYLPDGLAERMTVKLKRIYSNLREGLDYCHEDCVCEALDSLEELFGEEFFQH